MVGTFNTIHCLHVSDKREVEQFLKQFKIKLKVFGILDVERKKNTQTLLDLELLLTQRRKILEQLKVEDYCEGPLEETMHGESEMWVFGKEVKGTEVYIKIALGAASEPVICISFHIAEYKLNYPFK